MGVRVTITHRAIDREEIQFPLEPPHTGAIVEFFGVVRDHENDRRIEAIEYEAHKEMATHQMLRIAERLSEEHDLADFECFHRIGYVPAGEPSLLVRVASIHREAAFAAIMTFIDELKQIVPIWKTPIHSA